MNESREPPVFPPNLAVFLGILAVSTSSIFIRFAQENAPSLVIAAFRLSLATLILLPSAVKPNNRVELMKLTKKEILLAILSGIFLAFHFATWISSLAYTTVASSVVLVNTSPLWVSLLAPIFLKERIRGRLILSLVITFGGGFIVGISDVCQLGGGGVSCPSAADILAGNSFIGDILALLGAMFASGYLLIGRLLRSKMSLISYTFLVYGVAALILLSATLVGRMPLTGYPGLTYVWFLALAVVPQLLGHSTFNWVLRYLSAAFVSIALLGEPIGSTILAFLILGEIPSLLKIVGAVLILTGIVFASRVEATPKITRGLITP